jgi:hypothetical protein
VSGSPGALARHLTSLHLTSLHFTGEEEARIDCHEPRDDSEGNCNTVTVITVMNNSSLTHSLTLVTFS